MHVEALNAVARERARIRKEILNLDLIHLEADPDAVGYIERELVLAILTDNIIKPGEVITGKDEQESNPTV